MAVIQEKPLTTATPIWDEACSHMIESPRWEAAFSGVDTGDWNDEFKELRALRPVLQDEGLRVYALLLGYCAMEVNAGEPRPRRGWQLYSDAPIAASLTALLKEANPKPNKPVWRSAPSNTSTASFANPRSGISGYFAVGVHAKTDQIKRRILSFSKLEDDWDGYGAPPIADAVIRRALDAVVEVQLRNPHLPDPFAAPSGDGSILLRWALGRSKSIEAFVDSDNITVLVEDGGTLLEFEAPDGEQLARLIKQQTTRQLS